MILRSGLFVGLLILGALVLAVFYLKEEMPRVEEYLPPVGALHEPAQNSASFG